MDFRELQRTLRRKLGATEDRRGHHVFCWMEIAGSEYRIAKYSHSSRGQVPDYILSDTAKRLKLSIPELHQLVDCMMSGEACLDLWMSR